MDTQKIKSLQEEFDLSYHIEYVSFAEKIVGFKGKRVLEVGGSLPSRLVLEELGAAQWTALEEMDYWVETLSTGHVLGTPPLAQDKKIKFSDADPALSSKNHNIYYGRIEELPSKMENQFDLVFSIAAFEHIARLPLALDKMQQALVPGGKLFAMFAPVWSSYNGHHLPEIEDAAGNHWSFGNSPVPPWGHLLFSPTAMMDLLLQKCDRKTAQEIVYFLYHSPHINRFFADDYVDIARKSGFIIEKAQPIFPMAVPEVVQQQLQTQYPSRTDFTHSGILLVLQKNNP